ncbi:hypothetical protein FKM82_019784, partial [Ascaphus truei]
AEGGVITNHYYAEYLFSSDASHHDTQRIYHSLAYVEDKATVFHSSFLQANSRSEIRSLVSLGHFILPPICLHEEIKRRIGSFIWEQESSSSPIEQQMETHSGRKRDGKEDKQQVSPECEIRKEMAGSDSAGSEELTYYTLQNYPVNNMLIGKIHIADSHRQVTQLH